MIIDPFEKHPGRYVSGVQIRSYKHVGITPPLIGVVNYKAGNIRSISTALNLLGADTCEVASPGDIDRVDGLVLPGVGAFSSAMDALSHQGLLDAIPRYAIEYNRPFLGICLGMQLLTESSTEFGLTDGLGMIPGETVAMKTGEKPLPHVGWNEVEITHEGPMYAGIPDGTHFYFDHSFAVSCADAYVSSYSSYGSRFVASIHAGNIWATQFHPEKSQVWGLKLLRNYLEAVVGGRDDA